MFYLYNIWSLFWLFSIYMLNLPPKRDPIITLETRPQPCSMPKTWRTWSARWAGNLALRHWAREKKCSLNPSPAASDRRAHVYEWCSAASRTGGGAILLMSIILCVPGVGLWHGCRLWGTKTLELNFVSLFYLYFLEQVQDSVWKDEGQVHPNPRHTSPHQSQEGLLECQWCMHPFLLSSAVVGTAGGWGT